MHVSKCLDSFDSLIQVRALLTSFSDLYDFYMHGDLDSLEKANGVRKSDVWFLLNGTY